MRAFALAALVPIAALCQPLGIFESHADVGTVLRPGSAEFDGERKTYRVSGSGENMWANADAFQFAWKKVSGDVTLAADISILGTGGEAHRKAVLMIRQSLDADSAYADAALHGNGLTSIQGRTEKGGITTEVQSSTTAPKHLRIAKRGDSFYLWVGDPLSFSGGSMRIHMTEPFYVGLGVCAHNKDNVETAEFSNVELTVSVPAPTSKGVMYSTIEIMPVPGDRRATFVARGKIEMPVWSRDGSELYFLHDARIERVAVAGGPAHATAAPKRVISAFGVSPDGTQLAFTDANIYVMPIPSGVGLRPAQRAQRASGAGAGQEAYPTEYSLRQLTHRAESESSFGGWSPDGKTIAFTGLGAFGGAIYTIPAEGGAETRVASRGENPKFSPDGQYIYFDSGFKPRQVWRVRLDGSDPEQVTSGDLSNWSPSVSPDGRRLAILSSGPERANLMATRDISVRVLMLPDLRVQTAVKLVGGPGSAPAWSPDCRRLAFVSYQYIEE